MFWFMVSLARAGNPALEIVPPEVPVVDWTKAEAVARRDCRKGGRAADMSLKMLSVGSNAKQLGAVLLLVRDAGVPNFGHELLAAYGWRLSSEQQEGLANTLLLTQLRLGQAARHLVERLKASDEAAFKLLTTSQSGRLHGNHLDQATLICSQDRLLNMRAMVSATLVLRNELVLLKALNDELAPKVLAQGT